MSALIWWTSGPDYAVINCALGNQPSLLPMHIVDAFESRRGRNGRGRLWPVEGLGSVEATCAAERWDSPLGKVLTEYYGGIVIDAADLGAVWDLPGIVTDLQVVRVSKT